MRISPVIFLFFMFLGCVSRMVVFTSVVFGNFNKLAVFLNDFTCDIGKKE